MDEMKAHVSGNQFIPQFILYIGGKNYILLEFLNENNQKSNT